MSALQAVVIAILQGATELFPVSSLGHAVVLPALLHWPLDQRAPEFLPFLVMLHLGTAAALLLYFWRDWWLLLLGVLGISDPHQARESRRVLLLIIIATIPAVIVGGLLERFFRSLFGAPMVAAARENRNVFSWTMLSLVNIQPPTTEPMRPKRMSVRQP